jgi:Glucose dehydrogenase
MTRFLPIASRAAAASIALFLAVSLAAEAPAGARADWSTYGGGFHNQHFSLLREINTSNVAGLAVAWTVAIPDAGAGDVSLQTTPLVIRGREAGLPEVDALMFVTSPRGRVLALDGASGKVLWTAEPALREPLKLCCSMTNRGVAFGRVGLGEPRVYVATPDARLWAFSATDGTTATGFTDGEAPGAVTVGDNTLGVSLTMAPLFISRDEIPPGGATGGKDVVIVGSSGGEFEARGSLTAFDALTGQQLWRFFTVPAPGEFGGETWPKAVQGPFADAYSRGGGAVWMTPAYEPKSGRLFFTVANPSPNLDGTHRAGNNLFTDSIVAVDVRTGRRIWHYQQVHHDLWDYDPASPPLLIEVHGRRAVAEASKTGFFYILDRDTGVPLFACPETPVPASTFTAFDGSPEITSPTQPVCPAGLQFVPVKEPGAMVPDPSTGAQVESIFTPPSWNFRPVAPGIFGGAEWSPVAYHPDLGLAFISGVIAPFLFVPFGEFSPTPGTLNLGGLPIPVVTQIGGTVTAIDVNAGTVRWQRKTRWPLVGGALVTAGDVLFYGEGYPLAGSVVALAASTGIEMFRFWTTGGVNAAPMTYRANGRQFVTVAAGGAPHYLSRADNLLVTFAIKDGQ